MKKWRRYLPLGIVTLVLAVAFLLTVDVKAQVNEDATIPERVYFDTISGGGLSQEDAAKAVGEYVKVNAKKKITLVAGNNRIDVTAEELGLSWSNPEIVEEATGLGKTGNLIVRYKAMKDLEHEDKVYKISYSVDGQKVAAALEQNVETLNTEAMNAGLTRENGGFVIVAGSQGITVNVEESIKAVEAYFTAEWDGKDGEVTLVADIVEPKGTEEELSKVKDVLGSFNTSYGSSAAGRAKNVANGAERINGSVIYPGDEFSVYSAVSPFDAENGYELAGSYENGTTVETYGGGICQVSTTLYNAVIRAELEIVERFAHSMIVTYVEPSQDAAIAGTYKDLKFKNNTDAPIYIEGYTSGMVLYFTVFGQETRDANREVTYVSDTTSTTNPGVEFRASGAGIGSISKVQSSHTGKTAQLWKVITVNGVEESREVFNKSTYKASPTIYEVGTSSGNPDAVANINAALATQDEGTIRAAASSWNDAAVAAMVQQQEEEAAAQAQQEQEQKEAEEKAKKESDDTQKEENNDKKKSDDTDEEDENKKEESNDPPTDEE